MVVKEKPLSILNCQFFLKKMGKINMSNLKSDF